MSDYVNHCSIESRLQVNDVAGKVWVVIALDDQLLCEARRWITTVNMFLVKKLMFAYEQAVTFHNTGCAGHEKYHDQCESHLRSFIFQSRMQDLEDRIFAVKAEAAVLMEKSRHLHEHSDDLNRQIDRIFRSPIGQ